MLICRIFASLAGYADALWWACGISPIFTMLILLHLKPTGIWNAEGQNLKRYYDQCPVFWSGNICLVWVWVRQTEQTPKYLSLWETGSAGKLISGPVKSFETMTTCRALILLKQNLDCGLQIVQFFHQIKWHLWGRCRRVVLFSPSTEQITTTSSCFDKWSLCVHWFWFARHLLACCYPAIRYFTWILVENWQCLAYHALSIHWLSFVQDEYAKYRENTSVLIPMVGYKHVPLILKRPVYDDLRQNCRL